MRRKPFIDPHQGTRKAMVANLGQVHESKMTNGLRSDEIGVRTTRTELTRETVARIYERWAPVYDFVFGPVFDRGRHAAIAATERIAGRILDVGVGTGIALPYYASA